MITSSYSFFPFILAYDFGQRARRTLTETLKGPSVISIFPLLVSFFLSVNCVWMEPIWWKQDCIISKVITHIYAPAAIVSGVVLCCTHRTCLLIYLCTLLKKNCSKAWNMGKIGLSKAEDCGGFWSLLSEWMMMELEFNGWIAELYFPWSFSNDSCFSSCE